MKNTDLLIALAISVVVIIVALYILSKICKAIGSLLKPARRGGETKSGGGVKKYKSLAEFADVVASDPTAIDSNLHAIFTDMRDAIGSAYDKATEEIDKAVLTVPLASLEKIANAPIKDKSKPMFSSIGALGFAVEDKTVKLDAAIRGIFTEVYDYCVIFNCQSDEGDSLTDIVLDLEMALWPNGPSQTQEEAASRRQAKIEAAIRHKSAFSNAASTASGAMCE